MIECVRRRSRSVKQLASGDMARRWAAAGMLEAVRRFRRIIGHADLANLAVAIERERHSQPHVTHTPTEEAATLATA